MLIWSWLIRLLMGERPRKATPKERQFYAAFFLFIPLWGAVFVWFFGRFMNRAEGFSVWAVGMIALAIMASVSLCWARWVPEKVTWVFGGIVWTVTLFLALTGRLL